MLILVIDTCLGACQVAAVRGGQRLAGCSELMQRGHQERLALMTAEVMAEAGAGFDEIGTIAVTVGPGSFTGLRVGLAFARGLGLATGAPLAGIGTLEALAASGEARAAGVVDARRGQIYFQPFEAGRPLAAAKVLSVAEAGEQMAGLRRGGPMQAVGPGASLFDPALDIAAPSLEALVRLAGTALVGDPCPTYLRAPDAKLASR